MYSKTEKSQIQYNNLKKDNLKIMTLTLTLISLLNNKKKIISS